MNGVLLVYGMQIIKEEELQSLIMLANSQDAETQQEQVVIRRESRPHPQEDHQQAQVEVEEDKVGAEEDREVRVEHSQVAEESLVIQH